MNKYEVDIWGIKSSDMQIDWTRKKINKYENRCRNGMPKGTQTRKDKSDGKSTKPHPSLHHFTKRVNM